MTDTKKTKTCVVAMTHFTIDSRVRRETMAIVEDGCEVDVICLRESDPKIKISNSIVLHTMPMSKKRGGKLRYIFEYICFIIFSFFLLSWLYIRKKYSLVHIHNMPDVLVFCAIIPKFCGAKIILDIHDPMPELFMTKYCLRESSGFVRLLKFLEKISIRFSDRVLTPTKACRQLFVSRGCPINKISIIINTPDDRVFSTSDRHLWGKKPENKFVIMFHGTIAERNGLDIAVKAVNELQNEIDRLELRIYGDGDNLPNILKMISDLGIEDIVTYSGFVSFREISEALKEVNIGVVPTRKNPFSDLNLPVRIFEYLSMNVPVAASFTPGIKDYFEEDELLFFEADNVKSLKSVLLDYYTNPEKYEMKLEKSILVYKSNLWSIEKNKLLQIINDLLK